MFTQSRSLVSPPSGQRRQPKSVHNEDHHHQPTHQQMRQLPKRPPTPGNESLVVNPVDKNEEFLKYRPPSPSKRRRIIPLNILLGSQKQLVERVHPQYLSTTTNAVINSSSSSAKKTYHDENSFIQLGSDDDEDDDEDDDQEEEDEDEKEEKYEGTLLTRLNQSAKFPINNPQLQFKHSPQTNRHSLDRPIPSVGRAVKRVIQDESSEDEEEYKRSALEFSTRKSEDKGVTSHRGSSSSSSSTGSSKQDKENQLNISLEVFQSEVSQLSDDQWACEKCTFYNSNKYFVCEVCNEKSGREKRFKNSQDKENNICHRTGSQVRVIASPVDAASITKRKFPETFMGTSSNVSSSNSKRSAQLVHLGAKQYENEMPQKMPQAYCSDDSDNDFVNEPRDFRRNTRKSTAYDIECIDLPSTSTSRESTTCKSTENWKFPYAVTTSTSSKAAFVISKDDIPHFTPIEKCRHDCHINFKDFVMNTTQSSKQFNMRHDEREKIRDRKKESKKKKAKRKASAGKAAKKKGNFGKRFWKKKS